MMRRIWRLLPKRARGKVLGKFKASSVGQRLLKVVGSGPYSAEVLETGIIFIHVPKVAGTSVVKGLYGIDGIGHFTAAQIERGLSTKRENYKLIALTRCPWERAVSIYEFVKAGGTPDVPFINSADLQVPDSFSEYAKVWLPNYNENELSDVFKSQTHFLCDNSNNIIVDAVYKLDELGDFAVNASEIMDREIVFPRKNVVRRKEAMSHYYSDSKTIRSIEQFYKRDIELLGYKRPKSLNNIMPPL